MDIDYSELYGFELGDPVSSTGEREIAEPAAEGETGDKEQEVAELAREQEDNLDPGDDGPETGDDNTETGELEPPGQPVRERAGYAAARRKAEQERDAAIEQARQDMERKLQQEIDQYVSRMGLVNPETGRPITSRREYDEYQAITQRAREEDELQRAGISGETLNRLVSQHPDVVAAREAVRKLQQEEERARQEVIRQRLDAELTEIGKLDPTVTSLEALTKTPSYPAVLERVQRGYTLLDAYRLANMDAIAKNAAAASRQAAINAERSKAHLEASRSRGAGAVSVPADIAEDYRALNPGMTTEEIERHYNQYVASRKST